MSSELVNVTVDGPVATVTMTDPDHRNALSIAMMTALRDAIGEAGASDAQVIVLAGEGKAFSAGHDLKEMRGIDEGRAATLFRLVAELMEIIREVPQAVIAKVGGMAAAGGAQLAAACDLAIAAEDAKFALPGIKVGLFCHTPNVEISRNIAPKRAFELAVTGDPITAVEAAEWGLINRAVPTAELDDAVADLAARICAAGPAYSRAVGKRVFYQQLGIDRGQAYGLTTEILTELVPGREAQEGVTSFAEKRTPQFKSTIHHE